MKMLEKYKSLGIYSQNAAFEHLMSELKDTIRTYDFYVAWDKVLDNVASIEVALNILNTLIGKNNIESKLRELIKSYPEIVPVIPALIAVRGTNIKIATVGGDIDYSFAKKKHYSDEEINQIIDFSRACGLLKILEDKNVKNLVDYCTGVEVGLDTNARKNRSGTAMEGLVEVYVKAICEKNGYSYIPQATVSKIKSDYGVDVPTDKADRHFDFAIKTTSKIHLLEVNYYSGGGSKLKSVAGEFKSLYQLMKDEPNVEFVWITDGLGWNTAKRPLLETFNETDYVFNIKMIEEGLLKEALLRG